jgi:hypothetical protein
MSCEFCKPKPNPNFRFPKVGETISWFGTIYKVTGVNSKEAIIAVNMNNGIELTLWWRDDEGCEIV